MLANDAGRSGTVGCGDDDVVVDGADVVGSVGDVADDRDAVAVAPALSQGFGGDTMFVEGTRWRSGNKMRCVTCD